MPAASTDLHDPTVRALAVAAGGLVYGLIVFPAVVAWPRSWQAACLVTAGLTVAASTRRDRLLTDDADGADTPELVGSVAAAMAAMLLFDYGLGAVAPGLRDAAAQTGLVLGAGAVAGLLLVGTASLVRR